MRRLVPLAGLFCAALIAVAGCAATAAETRPAPPPPPANTYTGTLSTEVRAIGGETTGVTLATADRGVYELEFGTDRELRKKAESLNGRKVTIVGDYRPKAGVEIKERRIVVVTRLRAAD